MKTESGVFIHESADVQTNYVGAGTKIWQFVVVLNGARIGQYCNINAHCLLEGNTVIGDNTTLKSGVYVWNGLRIGNNVFVGPNVTFVNDQRPKNKRYITHPLTIIEDDVSIGANSCIGAGLTIGKGAMTGMGAVVTKDVPPYALVYGNPAVIKGWVDEDGEPMSLLEKGKFRKSDGGIVTLDEQNNLISFNGI
jgi:UDP-2-acetamido-3-amino-2,3-dideoxy-glucuronate N-acetyltransferase